MDEWLAGEYTGAWLRLGIKNCSLIETASENFGFEIHHAKNDHVVMSKWLVPHSKSKLPCYSTHNLGVGGIVLSPCKTKILLIKENYARLMHLWKFPGGLVDEGESIEKAVIREVWEETGVKSDFLGIIGFRE